MLNLYLQFVLKYVKMSAGDVMQQYFIKGKCKINECFVFDNEQAHHIKNVLRMKNGSQVRVVDEDEIAYSAQIIIDVNGVSGIACEKLMPSESSIKTSLIMGLIKGDKWDYLLQKACECGAYEILPMISSRCVVKAKEEKADKKLARWNKIAIEACEQCKRTHRAQVLPTADFKQSLQCDADLKLIAYEDADLKACNLAAVFDAHASIHSIAVMIGPEGGFSISEVEQAEAAGFIRVSLGSSIFRAETAALFALNAISYHYDIRGELK